jgi:hypothetical protein
LFYFFACFKTCFRFFYYALMEELHTDSIDGGHEASYGARSRAREKAYSNTPLSFLPTNTISVSSPSFSPSLIGSLPSPTCSDLAAKYAEFERDYSLPASSILPADIVLPLSPHTSLMPNSMPNASDTDIPIKLAAFKDALACLLPAAFNAVVKVLALPELFDLTQAVLNLCLSPYEKYRIGALAFLIHESSVETACIERDQLSRFVRMSLSTKAKNNDEYREDPYTLPANTLPAAVSTIRIIPKGSWFAHEAFDSPSTIRGAALKASAYADIPSLTFRPTPTPPPASALMPDPPAMRILDTLPEWAYDALYRV